MKCEICEGSGLYASGSNCSGTGEVEPIIPIKTIKKMDIKINTPAELKPIKEVCEWDTWKVSATRKCGCNPEIIEDLDRIDTYKYCPYCGKPIKIKGE